MKAPQPPWLDPAPLLCPPIFHSLGSPSDRGGWQRPARFPAIPPFPARGAGHTFHTQAYMRKHPNDLKALGRKHARESTSSLQDCSSIAGDSGQSRKMPPITWSFPVIRSSVLLLEAESGVGIHTPGLHP